MRLPWPAVAGGVFVAVLGAAGLIRGAVPQPASGAGPTSATTAQVAVSGAYVRAPVPPTKIAAAYFTIYNTTNAADRLIGIQTGAGSTAVLHKVNPDGSMSATPDAVIPAHGSLVLTTGQSHVMIEHLFGPLKAGQSVNIELDFQTAGSINVIAPVVAPGASAPNAEPSPSGVHS